MKERPILFSAPMVRAILSNTKTQTRRVVKPQPPQDAGEVFCGWYYPTIIDRQGHEQRGPLTYGAWTLDGAWGLPSPHGQPRDQLWVREAWTTHAFMDNIPPRDLQTISIHYQADGKIQTGKHRQAFHMPRRYSRITLEITSVRVERLQDISNRDAIAEGIPCGGPENPDGIEKREYRNLWESINGPGSWDANPWVWVVEFKKIAGGSL
jgi:hypothetical protein